MGCLCKGLLIGNQSSGLRFAPGYKKYMQGHLTLCSLILLSVKCGVASESPFVSHFEKKQVLLRYSRFIALHLISAV